MGKLKIAQLENEDKTTLPEPNKRNPVEALRGAQWLRRAVGSFLPRELHSTAQRMPMSSICPVPKFSPVSRQV